MSRLRSAMVSFAAVAIASAAFAQAGAPGTRSAAVGPVPEQQVHLIDLPIIRKALYSSGSAEVIVMLREPIASLAEDGLRLKAIAAAQDDLLATLPAGSWVTRHRYGLLAALSGTVSSDGLERLLVHPSVVSVEPNRLHSPLGRSMLAEQRALLGVDEVWRRWRLSGNGVNVAIIDTGIDAEHPDLANAIVDQRCFSSAGGCGTNNATEGPVANDEDGHGTGITAIVTSDGMVAPRGIAPDAGIVALRVFDRRNRAATDDIIAGLDWLDRNRQRLGVRVVNMSIGTDETYVGNCDSSDAVRAASIRRLMQRGITIFGASGNHGSTNALAMPACLRDVIAVGATYDGDLGRQPPEGNWGSINCFDEPTGPNVIACFSNISRNLALVAPGLWTTTSRLGGGAAQTAGTSNASPVAAGVAALLLQANDGLRHADVLRILTNTGVAARRNGSNLSVPRIDALAAVESLGLPTVTPAGPAPTATDAPSVTATSTAVATATADGSATAIATVSATATATADDIATATPTLDALPSATSTASPTQSVTPTADVTASPGATSVPPAVRIYLPLARVD